MISEIWMLLLVTSIFGFIPSLTSYSVYIHDKPFSSIDAINICKCKYLTKINVTNSSTKLLPSRFLVNCHSLETLILSKNEIMEITHDTFNDLSNLLTLDLSRNHITTLPKDVFKPLTNLIILVLNRNRIEMIDSNLFLHNQYLFHLDISDNNLKTIEPKSFRMLEYLYFLNMYNNPSLNSTDFLYDDRYVPSSINMAN
ncbi:slit homolog 2 protein-like, partial [Contarinia nasturtii]|uniref:slit homolog 2 protein-like n=1 Tax=Contarinia nasturtii TaxID=265458 RepID=UPI0012D44AB2